MTQSKINKNLEQCNGFLRSQADSAAVVARTMACAMIGVVWAFSFNNGNFTIPTGWLLSSLVSNILFFLIDLLHYFSDTCVYHSQTIKLQEAKTNNDYDETLYESKMTLHSKVSFGFFVTKCFICLIAGVLLLIGIIV